MHLFQWLSNDIMTAVPPVRALQPRDWELGLLGKVVNVPCLPLHELDFLVERIISTPRPQSFIFQQPGGQIPSELTVLGLIKLLH